VDLERAGVTLKAGPGTAAADSGELIVARAAAGDRAAFTDLVDEHHADMQRLAGVILGDPELARDAVQLAWMRAWTGLRRLRDYRRVRPWLLSIAANEARQLVRKRRAVIQSGDALLGVVDPVDHFRGDLDLNAALDRLDPADRELLGLRYVLGFTSVELGAQLGLSAEGVRARLKRLVDRLREELTDA
jgi:RNA polymerase sigma-70 factor (ECF subfamily)